MSLNRRTRAFHCLPGVFLLLVLAGVAVSGRRAASQPSADTIRDLLKKRQAVLQEAVHVAEAGYRQGEIGLVSVLDLRRDLVNAKLQLATSPAQRIALYKELVENMKALEKVTKRLHEAREARYIDYLKSKAARLARIIHKFGNSCASKGI